MSEVTQIEAIDPDRPRRCGCLGIPLDPLDLPAATAALINLAVEDPAGGPDRRGHHVHLCSSDTIVRAAMDEGLLDVMQSASLNLPDGMGVVMGARFANRGSKLAVRRVAGTDFMESVWSGGEAVGLRHYLLGSSENVQASLQRHLRSTYPRALLVGAESPPFRTLSPDEVDAQVGRLIDSSAQVVWVGLGSPKQDWAVAELATRVPAVFVAVGAAFDFLAASKRRAPRWMQRAGLEWLWRLATEPQRLWRRYLIGLPTFAWLLLRDGKDGRRGA